MQMQLGHFAALIVLFVIAGLVTVQQRLELIRLGYQRARLETLTRELVREHRELRARMEMLSTPRAAARKLREQPPMNADGERRKGKTSAFIDG